MVVAGIVHKINVMRHRIEIILKPNEKQTNKSRLKYEIV